MNLLYLLSLLLLCSCANNQSDYTDASVEVRTLSQTSSDTLPKIDSQTCFNDIHIIVDDSFLLYMASVAIDSVLMQAHSGNRRIAITDDGKYYYSRNKGNITDLSNYFNQDLALYKTLSEQELGRLKKMLKKQDFTSVDKTREQRLYKGGYKSYLHLNMNGSVSCAIFEPRDSTLIEIENLLNELQ